MLDSGSEASLINKKVYDEIPAAVRPPLLKEKPNLVTASEQKLRIYGKVVMQVTVRDVVFDQDFWVSDMIEDGIFGVDMLRAQSAQVDFKRAKLYMRGKSIAIQTSRGRPIHTKVIAMRSVVIPPSTECVLTGKICATKRHQATGPSQALLEPAQLFYQKTGGLVCKELVNAANPTVPIRVYNPRTYSVLIPAHITLGVLSEVLEVKVHAEVEPKEKPKPKKHKTRVQQICRHEEETLVGSGPPTQWLQDQEEAELGDDAVLPEHMQSLYERAVEGLPVSDHAKVARLLIRNSDVFASHKSDLGRTHLVKHTIETGDEPPVRDPPRRLPMAQTEEVHKQVKTLYEQGIISPSNGQWASNIVMVKKKDETWRMCIDYRELNLKTKNTDPYMLPRIDETLDRLSDAKYFSILDLLMGFHQVELDESSKEKTGFQVPRMYPSHWKFEYMPFGLTGAPRTFQRLIDKMLGELPFNIAMAYLDDIIVHSRTIDEGIERLQEVFNQLRIAGLKLKAKKCELFRKKVLYLGHIVSAEGVTTDPDKVTAILAWRAPRTVRQIKRFLATVSYYRRFIPKFAGIAEPLTNLQRKRVRFNWTSECQEAFETLRTCLVTSPVLAYPRDDGQYILDTDASEHSISGALSQMQLDENGEWVERMIANGSKTLNTAERRYCVRRREMKAIVQFAKHFRPYLYGREVIFRTDHASLRYVQTMRNGSDQFHRWMEILSEFKYKIEVRKGALHVNADGLSRLGCNGKKCVCAQVDQFERTPGIVNNHNVVCSMTTASSLFCVTGMDGERRMRDVASGGGGDSDKDSIKSSDKGSSSDVVVKVEVVRAEGREVALDELTEDWQDRARRNEVRPMEGVRPMRSMVAVRGRGGPLLAAFRGEGERQVARGEDELRRQASRDRLRAGGGRARSLAAYLGQEEQENHEAAVRAIRPSAVGRGRRLREFMQWEEDKKMKEKKRLNEARRDWERQKAEREAMQRQENNRKINESKAKDNNKPEQTKPKPNVARRDRPLEGAVGGAPSSSEYESDYRADVAELEWRARQWQRDPEKDKIWEEKCREQQRLNDSFERWEWEQEFGNLIRLRRENEEREANEREEMITWNGFAQAVDSDEVRLVRRRRRENQEREEDLRNSMTRSLIRPEYPTRMADAYPVRRWRQAMRNRQEEAGATGEVSVGHINRVRDAIYNENEPAMDNDRSLTPPDLPNLVHSNSNSSLEEDDEEEQARDRARRKRKTKKKENRRCAVQAGVMKLDDDDSSDQDPPAATRPRRPRGWYSRWLTRSKETSRQQNTKQTASEPETKTKQQSGWTVPRIPLAERLTLPNSRAVVAGTVILATPEDIARSKEYERTGRLPEWSRRENADNRYHARVNVNHTQHRDDRGAENNWLNTMTAESESEVEFDPLMTSSPRAKPAHRYREPEKKAANQTKKKSIKKKPRATRAKAWLEPRRTTEEEMLASSAESQEESGCKPYEEKAERKDTEDDDEKGKGPIVFGEVRMAHGGVTFDYRIPGLEENKSVPHQGRQAALRPADPTSAAPSQTKPCSYQTHIPYEAMTVSMPKMLTPTEAARRAGVAPGGFAIDCHMQGPVKEQAVHYQSRQATPQPANQATNASGQAKPFLQTACVPCKALIKSIPCMMTPTEMSRRIQSCQENIIRPRPKYFTDSEIDVINTAKPDKTGKYIPPHLRSDVDPTSLMPEALPARRYGPWQRYQRTLQEPTEEEKKAGVAEPSVIKPRETVKSVSGKDSKEPRVAVWCGDIATLEVDVIVNAANFLLAPGDGVDGAIRAAAGPGLQEETALLGGCRPGEAKITKAYDLPSKFVIHTVGPKGFHPSILASCYDECLALMSCNGLKSIAFPCIATGAFGYPRVPACQLAMDRVRKYLSDNPFASLIRVIFCTYLPEDDEIYRTHLPLYFPPMLIHAESMETETTEQRPEEVRKDEERLEQPSSSTTGEASRCSKDIPSAQNPELTQTTRQPEPFPVSGAVGGGFLKTAPITNLSTGLQEDSLDGDLEAVREKQKAKWKARTERFHARRQAQNDAEQSRLELDAEKTKIRLEIVNKRTQAMSLLRRIRLAWCEAVRNCQETRRAPQSKTRKERKRHRIALALQEEDRDEKCSDYNQQSCYVRWLATQMTNAFSDQFFRSRQSITLEGKPVDESKYPKPPRSEPGGEEEEAEAQKPVGYQDYLETLRIHRLRYIQRQKKVSEEHWRTDLLAMEAAREEERAIQEELQGLSIPSIPRPETSSKEILAQPTVQDKHVQLTQARMLMNNLRRNCQVHAKRVEYLTNLENQLQVGQPPLKVEDLNQMLFPVSLRNHQDLILVWEKEEAARLSEEMKRMAISINDTNERKRSISDRLRRLNSSGRSAPTTDRIEQVDGPDPEAMADPNEQEDLKERIDECARQIATTVSNLHQTETNLSDLLSRQQRMQQEEEADVWFTFADDFKAASPSLQQRKKNRNLAKVMSTRRSRQMRSESSSSEEDVKPALFPMAGSARKLPVTSAARTSGQVLSPKHSPLLKRRRMTIAAGEPGHEQKPISVSSDTDNDMSDLTQLPAVLPPALLARRRDQEAKQKEIEAEKVRQQEDDDQVTESEESDTEEEAEDEGIVDGETSETEDSDEDDQAGSDRTVVTSDTAKTMTPKDSTASSASKNSDGTMKPTSSCNSMSRSHSQQLEQDFSQETSGDETVLPVDTDHAEEARAAGVTLLTSVVAGCCQDHLRQNKENTIYSPLPYYGPAKPEPTAAELREMQRAWEDYAVNQQTQSTDGTLLSVTKVVNFLQQHDINSQDGSLKRKESMAVEPEEDKTNIKPEDDTVLLSPTRVSTVQYVTPEHPCQVWREDTRMVATTGEDSSESIFQSTERLNEAHLKVTNLMETVRPFQEEAFQEIWKRTVRQIEQTRGDSEANMVIEDLVDDAVEIQDMMGSLKIRAVSFGSWWTANEMRTQQEEDTDVGPVASILFADEVNPGPKWFANCSASTQLLAKEWEKLIVHAGVLYRKWESSDGAVARLQLVLPVKHRARVISLLHDECTAGHLGVQKTLYRVQLRYYWPRMIEDIRRFVQTCDPCQRRKTLKPTPKAPMKLYQTGVPFQRIAMDICGPIIKSGRCQMYILVISDYFSKFTMVIPVPDKTTITVATALASQWITLWGCPQFIHTDQGLEFESGLIHELCRRFGIHKTKTTPYRPQSDGMVERFNSTMMQIVSTLCDNYEDWDLHLPFAQMAFNSTVHSTTGETPNKIVQGRHLHMPIDVITQLDASDEDVVAQHEYVRRLEDRLRTSHDVVRKYTARSMSKQKYYHDRGTCYNDYQEDDLVLLKIMEHAPFTGKLAPRYDGPYVVIEKRINDTFLIQKDEESRATTVQHNRLKPYFTTENVDISWAERIRERLSHRREAPALNDELTPEGEKEIMELLRHAQFSRAFQGQPRIHTLGTDVESTDGGITTTTATEPQDLCDQQEEVIFYDDVQVPEEVVVCDMNSVGGTQQKENTQNEEDVVSSLNQTSQEDNTEAAPSESNELRSLSPVSSVVSIDNLKQEENVEETAAPVVVKEPVKRRKPGFDWEEVDSDEPVEKIEKLAKSVADTDALHNTRFQRRKMLQDKN